VNITEEYYSNTIEILNNTYLLYDTYNIKHHKHILHNYYDNDYNFDIITVLS